IFVVALTKTTMEFIEGSRGIYRPIRVMFDTPIYERALQTCWHMGSYKCQIALVTELLSLQQNNQLPSAVTAEDITEFLVEESKSTLRVQLWEFELEDYAADVRPLLKLAWEVNTSMKMRDVEFEARRLLSSPGEAPPQFQHPKIISEAHMYARRLTEQQQEARGPKQLSPQEVVIEVVPKVLQGFWLPPPSTFLNMPSQDLCTMAVGVTKAVEDRVSTALSSLLCHVPFSRSTRDYLVLSIQEKVRQGHSQDVLVEKLNFFAAEVLNTITDVAAIEICSLLRPEPHTSVSSIPVQQPPSNLKPDCAVVSPPPSPLTPLAEPPANTGFSKAAVQPTTRLGVKSAMASAPPSPMSLPAVVIPGVLDPEHKMGEPTKDQDSIAVPAPTPPVTTPAEVNSSVLDPEINSEVPSREPESAVVSTPSFPMSPPAVVIPAVLDPEHRMEEPTRDSVVVPSSTSSYNPC
ncbi:hypothetical protein L3Q82_017074, partial [Scortum barcoo]